MDKPIFAICPSRGRPKRCEDMIKSFLDTTSGLTQLHVCFDWDDPKKEEYIKLGQIYKEVKFDTGIVHKNTITTEIFNEYFKCQQAELYHLVNDDFVYHTKGFDELIYHQFQINGEGVYYVNDALFKEELCTVMFITNKVARAVGWIQMPKLKCLYGDTVWMNLSKGCHINYYINDVFVEHKHYLNDKAGIDETYLRTNSEDVHQHDNKQFLLWLTREKPSDVKKINKALAKPVIEG